MARRTLSTIMPIHVALNHRTEYRYDRPVQFEPHVARLRPAPHCRTPILSYSLKVTPEEHFLNWQQDPYNNYLARLVFPKPGEHLIFEVDLVAEMTVVNPFDFFLEERAEKFPFDYGPLLRRELAPYLEVAPAGEKLARLIEEHRRQDVRTVDYLVEVNRALQQRVEYLIRMEPGIQSPEETLEKGSGSCRDTAWLLVHLLRSLGLAARFASGYLIQLKPDVRPLEGPAGAEEDFTDLHAWTEVYVPGAGWIGLDPTSGLMAGEGHIPLACAADPVSAAPIDGSFCWTARAEVDRVNEEFQFSMKLTRVHEDARVTKPYTDQQWERILAAGAEIDRRLEADDVRLTMGGEPTFVSVDDMEGSEWNVTALGEAKRGLAEDLFRRLQRRFAPGAVLVYGQGKQYPGEPLPRWALQCYWRKDGEPVWKDLSLLADERRDYGHGPDHARRFLERLCEVLGVDPERVFPGYEDIYHYLWREQKLPANVEALDSRLEDEQERQRLARVFDRGLDQVVGYVLPIRRQHTSSGAVWASSPWFLRQKTMQLIPGDSSMGYRLPLESLPWVSVEDAPYAAEPDPIEPRRPLPPPPEGMQPRPPLAPVRPPERMQPRNEVFTPPRYGESAGRIVRTALCVQPRDGKLYLFLPPLEHLEDFLELVSAIEETARSLQLPVVLEGYPPPYDPRLDSFSLSPDPGVIEVNIHPSRTWEELVHKTSVLYEEAHLSRLGTEKFMLDGRHSGTGGGNHILLGGLTPDQSPLLRRPTLLRSLIGYWLNHPSLSYLFSSLFIGPTSQAPRVDEARTENVYELELAFAQIPDDPGADVPLWLVDRVFRHLLTDVTGNTHRAEFCIDKLYSPDSASGRRGLVELRAFEMPPHSRMSLVQHLLLRALVARFWSQPYRERLIRWGTELHDRFMLPYFARQDFRDVLRDLRQDRIDLPESWFEPHFEFRFPFIGSIVRQGVTLELRTAIEPWLVLGEEPGGGGTVRYVDSSLERLQVLASGLVGERYRVTCNRRALPLRPTGVRGEFVAGLRYRAWQPPSCLHPTIPVHTPLVLDVVDTWTGRSIGGCTYHVAHPGGRSYETFPVNAYEAESRRAARFHDMGHTPGPLEILEQEPNPEFPTTLDLRREARA